MSKEKQQQQQQPQRQRGERATHTHTHTHTRARADMHRLTHSPAPALVVAFSSPRPRALPCLARAPSAPYPPKTHALTPPCPPPSFKGAWRLFSRPCSSSATSCPRLVPSARASPSPVHSSTRSPRASTSRVAESCRPRGGPQHATRPHGRWAHECAAGELCARGCGASVRCFATAGGCGAAQSCVVRECACGRGLPSRRRLRTSLS